MLICDLVLISYCFLVPELGYYTSTYSATVYKRCGSSVYPGAANCVDNYAGVYVDLNNPIDIPINELSYLSTKSIIVWLAQVW